MLSIDRTPLSTRLLNGHDTNCRFGSSRTTSIDGSARRTYLAAGAPPHPPPITTTRRPVFWAKSETVGAQPAASRPSPVPEVRRNSLRVDAIIRRAPCSPERAGAQGARECHPDAERETAGERAEPHGWEHPLALVLEVGVFQDGEAQRRHDERQRRRSSVLGIARQEGLPKGAHEAEARSLEDHAERGAEEQKDEIGRASC